MAFGNHFFSEPSPWPPRSPWRSLPIKWPKRWSWPDSTMLWAPARFTSNAPGHGGKNGMVTALGVRGLG